MPDDEFSPRVNDLHGQTGSVIASALLFSPLLHPRCPMPFYSHIYKLFETCVCAQIRDPGGDWQGKLWSGDSSAGSQNGTAHRHQDYQVRGNGILISRWFTSRVAIWKKKKKKRDVSAMNNVRYIRHFSGCVRFPSVPWRFLLIAAAFTVLVGTRRDSIIRLSSKWESWNISERRIWRRTRNTMWYTC